MGIKWVRDDQIIIALERVRELRTSMKVVMHCIDAETAELVLRYASKTFEDYKRQEQEDYIDRTSRDRRIQRLFLAYQNGLVPDELLDEVKKEIWDWQNREYDFRKEV